MNEIEQKQVKALTSALGVSERFAELLVRRGFSDPEKAKKFLFPSVDHVEDPLLLTGMEQAVRRIRTALENQEKKTMEKVNEQKVRQQPKKKSDKDW